MTRRELMTAMLGVPVLTWHTPQKTYDLTRSAYYDNEAVLMVLRTTATIDGERYGLEHHVRACPPPCVAHGQKNRFSQVFREDHPEYQSFMAMLDEPEHEWAYVEGKLTRYLDRRTS